MEWKGRGPDSGPPTESFLTFLVRWAADPLTLMYPLGEDFERQRLEPEVIAGVEQDRAIRNGHDLRHQRSHGDVVARFAFGRTDFPDAVRVVSDGHEDVETGIDIETPADHAIAGDGGFEIGLTVRCAGAGRSVARDVEVLAAIAAAAVILGREVFLDLPH